MAGAQIGHRGARKANRVDAEMAVEAAVLGGDHRLWQIGRHFLQRDRLPKQIAESGKRAAVLSQDRDARPALADAELAGIGQGKGEIGEAAAGEDRRPQKQQQAEPCDAAEQPVRRPPSPRTPGWTTGRRPARRRIAWCVPQAVARIGAQRPVRHQQPLSSAPSGSPGASL